MLTCINQARDKLKDQLLRNAQIVIDVILEQDLTGLIEVGLFGSLVRGDFTCESDADIYLVFESELPERKMKGILRSIAEEHRCDLVFLKSADFLNPGLLVENIIADHQILYRRMLHD